MNTLKNYPPKYNKPFSSDRDNTTEIKPRNVTQKVKSIFNGGEIKSIM